MGAVTQGAMQGLSSDAQRKPFEFTDRQWSEFPSLPADLDQAFQSGSLQRWVEARSSNIEPLAARSIPLINHVSAGYPRDFTDLSYPPRVADEYVACSELDDPDAFAARVQGDSMSPKYRPGDIVIFSPAATPKNGDDCFVRFSDGTTTFKRVTFEHEESGTEIIVLHPRNPRYDIQRVAAENVSGLYKAMFRYQRVDDGE